MRRPLALALALLGCLLVAKGLYIPAKAALAQVLLERAWVQAQAGATDVKPWPWADITPVAALLVPRLHERAIVLEGVSGQAMAFGPGHMTNTAAIGAPGTAVIAAHRDTTFRFLKNLAIGDLVTTITADGQETPFRVVSMSVARADASGLDPQAPGPTGARLALVTCYPFEGVLHSPLRYVVIAERERPARNLAAAL